MGSGRLAEAEERWAALLEARPELHPAVAVQRRLLRHIVALTATIQQGRMPRLSLPPGYVAAKLARGVPALAGEPIPVPAAVIRPTLIALCDELAEGGADAARRIKSSIVETRIEAGSLLTASLMRHQPSIRTAAAQHDLAPDLLWLVAELAVSPYAFALQSLIFGAAAQHEALRSAVVRWGHGDCPACGSWPALAEFVSSSADLEAGRVLRCSFCAFAWSARPGCVYCGKTEPFARVWTDAGGEGLETCDACGGYLKIATVAKHTPFPLLAISDLASSHLDVGAMERGYTRPSIAETGVRPRV